MTAQIAKLGNEVKLGEGRLLVKLGEGCEPAEVAFGTFKYDLVISFKWILYQFQANLISISSESHINFKQILYQFQVNLIHYYCIIIRYYLSFIKQLSILMNNHLIFHHVVACKNHQRLTHLGRLWPWTRRWRSWRRPWPTPRRYVRRPTGLRHGRCCSKGIGAVAQGNEV